jgi:hypothetical protein
LLRYTTTAMALSALLAVGCSRASEEPVGDALLKGPPPAAEAFTPEFAPMIKGPKSPEGVQAILGTPDIGVGVFRVGFVLTSPQGFVTAPEATVTLKHYPSISSAGEARETVTAAFHPWPYGSRGLYTAELRFDKPGSWGLDISTEAPDGSTQTAQLRFDVPGAPLAPDIGDPAVKSVSKTVADVESLAQLTTGSTRDPDLYQTTIADAVSSGLPTVVVFASPAFCTNEVCGPQLEVLQQLKDKYKGRANFIHVDFYDNPHEIQGDLDRAVLSPVVLEWKLSSIEWSFVIAPDGIISARFEAFATFDEVEQALLRVL